MDREEQARRLLATYLEEVDEYVRALNRDLLLLEKTPEGKQRAELIHVLFRSVHSLKGASRAVGVTLVERSCHGLENALAEVRDGTRVLDGPLVELLFAATDGVGEVAARLRAGQALAGCALEALRVRIQALSQPAPAPVAAPAVEAEAAATAGLGEASVRVRAEKLDALLARTAELLVARGRLEGRGQDLGALGELLDRATADLVAVEKPLRRLLRAGAPPKDGGAEGPQRGAPRVGGRDVLAHAAGTGRAYSSVRRVEDAFQRARSNLRSLRRDLDRFAAVHALDSRLLEQAAVPLDDAIHRIRMFPFAEACEGLRRVVRDVAQAAGKEVKLEVVGGDTELDRAILEELKAPLMHLARNAVHHGIETADERAAAGKPRGGQVTVAAHLRGAQVDVTVEDDGRGLDVEAIREQVRRRKLPEPSDVHELARAIFQPGFSTARMITDISGRGVGLDVVRSRVEALHGSVDLSWQPGRGTRFSLVVPLTLTTVRALLVAAGGQTFAFPGTNVQNLLRLGPSDLLSIEGQPAIAVGGRPIPVVSLAEALGLRAADGASARRRRPTVIVAAGDRRAAFLVDELLAEQEVVVKALGPRLSALAAIAGGTVLPTGKVALILNAAAVLRQALGAASRAPLFVEAHAEAKRRLLVVDDVVTTRSLIRSLLEAAGYEVMAAADGVEAWKSLQEHGADLVVTDIEMPNMDGFELTRQVRASGRFRDLPVILVTGRESEQDRARGVEVGANAYIVKSGFDQRGLLDALAQLL